MITVRKSKMPLDLFHERTKVGAILQPMGLFYNRELQSAAVGDPLRFFNGRRAVVLGVCKVNMRSSVFPQLVKLIYGEYATPQRVYDRWKAHVMIEGHGVDAISDTECLMVRFADVDKDGNVINQSNGKKEKRHRI